MITTQLPAGLNDKSAEMYAADGMLMALTEGVTIPVIKSERLKSIVHRHMVNRPGVQNRMQEWVGGDLDAQVNQYGQCLWGTFNVIPDVDAEGNVSEPEFIHCSMRDTCPYSGVVCKSVKVSETESLSKAEERIIPLVLWADRIIGAQLNVSPFTVTTQIRNIKKKLNIQTKAEIVDWAKDNGIQLCK
jgi:DNA-binding CsgD family transcriptional regulator